MANERVVRGGQRWQPIAAGRARPGVRRRPAQRFTGWLRPAGRTSRPWLQPRLPALSDRAWRVALLGALAAVLVSAAWWLYQSPLLSLRGVNVKGTQVLSAETVRNVAGLDGQSLINPDFGGARARLEALPMVKEARISRDWPFGATITVVERTPWGVWQAGDRSFVIDNEGVILNQPAPPGAPVIAQLAPAPELAPGRRVDPGAVAVARQLLPTAEQTLGRPVTRLEFSQAEGLTVVLGGEPALRVVFGDAHGYDFKIAALYAVLKRAEEEGRTLRNVDLRFGDRVAVR